MMDIFTELNWTAITRNRLASNADAKVEISSFCMEVREAVLIAQRHPDTVKALLTELNRQKDKKGRPYHFALTTWDEEGIALPPNAA